MFRKIGYTWRVMGASWEVLKKDKELLLFPLLSGIACLLVLASFAIPIFATGAHEPLFAGGEEGELTTAQQVTYYGLLFLFYFCNYFVITFFNSAIVACAVHRLMGGDPTFGDGMRAAASRLPQIAGWALVAATVGLILRIIEDKSEKVGRLVAGLLGMAWTVLTFLVVPVLVVERKGPVAAFKKSAALLKKTWGEQLVGNFGFGMIFFLLALPAIAIVALGFVLGGPVAGFVCLGLAFLYWIALGLVQSALGTIFQAAVYVYAEKGEMPAGFDGELLQGAVSQK